MVSDTITKKLKEHALINNGNSILIGLSGGADSVCLTHALHAMQDEMGLTLFAAHVNHGIRGSEADADEKFAVGFCEKLGIKCFTLHADIPSIARERGLSEETAGRIIRYEFFNDLCDKYNIDAVATAHNKNDNAETIVMNFMRGSSVNGLSGIPFKRGNIIRPLLDVSREEIEQYCRENDLGYVTDSTNLLYDYTRNKIRHTLIPLIRKEFNDNFINTVTDNSRLIKEDGDYIDTQAKSFFENHVKDGAVSIAALMSEHIAVRRRVVRLMLAGAYGGLRDVSSGYVTDILGIAQKKSGLAINLFGNVHARNEYGMLIIRRGRSETPPFCREIAVNTTAVIEQIKKKVSVYETNIRENDGALYLGCDAEKITVRSRKNGDVFLPFGMNGSKKVKEYFIDRKIPRGERNAVPITEIGGEIAAVGERIDRRFIFKDKGIKVIFSDI